MLVNGARQTGKTTLARQIAGQEMRYLTLDDAATFSAADADPVGFIEGLGEPAVIDEVQKVPALLPAIKGSVDRQRSPGRFLLAGSADVLMLPTVSESLAGRVEPITLWPLSQGELAGVEESFVDALFATRTPRWPAEGASRDALVGRALRGGFPPAVQRSDARRRDRYAAYVTTIVQRDIRDLADVVHVAQLPRLLSLLAARSTSLLNTAELSRSTGIAHTTLQRYLVLLEQAFLLRMIPAWSSNRSKRLVKSPKVGLVDSGLAAHLAGVTSARLRSDPSSAGPQLEGFVAGELRKQLGWAKARADLFHFRTHGGREVDLVLEHDDGRITGIEVKASASVDDGDFKGLRVLQEEAAGRFVRGVLLYTGSEALSFGSGLQALPLGCLWNVHRPTVRA